MPQTVTHADSAMQTAMNTMWKTRSDMGSVSEFVDDVVGRPPEEHAEEEHSKDEHAVDQLLLRKKMHEESGYEKTLQTRDGQRDHDRVVHRQLQAVAREHRRGCEEDERAEHDQVDPHL